MHTIEHKFNMIRLSKSEILHKKKKVIKQTKQVNKRKMTKRGWNLDN